jgi:hypothetical protein
MHYHAKLISTIWATKQVLLANDEGDEASREPDDVPPQPQPQGPPLDLLMPQIMNAIQ